MYETIRYPPIVAVRPPRPPSTNNTLIYSYTDIDNWLLFIVFPPIHARLKFIFLAALLSLNYRDVCRKDVSSYRILCRPGSPFNIDCRYRKGGNSFSSLRRSYSKRIIIFLNSFGIKFFYVRSKIFSILKLLVWLLTYKVKAFLIFLKCFRS